MEWTNIYKTNASKQKAKRKILTSMQRLFQGKRKNWLFWEDKNIYIYVEKSQYNEKIK